MAPCIKDLNWLIWLTGGLTPWVGWQEVGLTGSRGKQRGTMDREMFKECKAVYQTMEGILQKHHVKWDSTLSNPLLIVEWIWGTTGSSLRKVQQENLKVLQRILKFQKRTVAMSALATFLKWVCKNVPEFRKSGLSFNGAVWDIIGLRLWDAATCSHTVAQSLSGPWRTVFESLKEHTVRQARQNLRRLRR